MTFTKDKVYISKTGEIPVHAQQLKIRNTSNLYELNNLHNKICCCLVIDTKGKTREGEDELDLTKEVEGEID